MRRDVVQALSSDRTSLQRKWHYANDVDAARIERSPQPNSLLTGKLTGNFADSGALQRFWHPVGERIQ